MNYGSLLAADIRRDRQASRVGLTHFFQQLIRRLAGLASH